MIFFFVYIILYSLFFFFVATFFPIFFNPNTFLIDCLQRKEEAKIKKKAVFIRKIEVYHHYWIEVVTENNFYRIDQLTTTFRHICCSFFLLFRFLVHYIFLMSQMRQWNLTSKKKERCLIGRLNGKVKAFFLAVTFLYFKSHF